MPTNSSPNLSVMLIIRLFYHKNRRVIFGKLVVVCVSKVRSQGKKEEVPIQLVLLKNKAKGTSNDYESQHEYTRTKGKW